MKKVIVIGCPGAGKSVFSRELHARTGLSLLHLDMLYWNEDGTKVPRELFLQRMVQALEGECWIIDGNYMSTMQMRMEACDTVIFLDYDTETCLAGVAARKGKKRPDMPWIEQTDDEAFLAFVRNFHDSMRPEIRALLERYGQTKRVIVFRERSEAARFLESETD